jgi:hypothetical protein
MKVTRGTSIMAIVLLLVLVVPAVIFAWFVSPWFLLILLGMVLIPLVFIDRGVDKKA